MEKELWSAIRTIAEQVRRLSVQVEKDPHPTLEDIRRQLAPVIEQAQAQEVARKA